MRAVVRPSLSPRTKAFLKKRTDTVAAAADKKSEAVRLWCQRSNKSFEEVRNALRSMSSGRERCSYCEDSVGTDIEHFWPKASYPLKAFLWENYLWACSLCNSNYKRQLFPLSETNEPLLIDPSVDDPGEHLALSFSTGRFVALTQKGQTSIDVFGLQRDLLAAGRRDAWLTIKVLSKNYRQLRDSGEAQDAAQYLEAIFRISFGGVLKFAIDALGQPGAHDVLGNDAVDCLQNCPELHGL